jgi:hypothetical protein
MRSLVFDLRRNAIMKENTVVRSAGWPRIVLVIFGVGVWLWVGAPQAFAANDPASCSDDAQSQQLNYWLGDWMVTYPVGSGSSTSKVTLSLDKCAVVENWSDAKGHQGESIFAYSADDKSWRGIFVDNQGRAHVFVDGKVADGAAEFYGPSGGAQGAGVLNRIRLVRLGADKVEQTWEKSTDNGATWTTAFRGEYSRKLP